LGLAYRIASTFDSGHIMTSTSPERRAYFIYKDF
jgi:hypothetical protein